MKYICPTCKREFTAFVSQKRKFCSRRHIRRPDNKPGKDAPHWQGGRTYNSVGAPYVYKPDHPLATKGKYVKESRLIMEKHIGRYLKPTEVVHHKDGNNKNNNINNLVLCKTRGSHTVKHHPEVMKKLQDANNKRATK